MGSQSRQDLWAQCQAALQAWSGLLAQAQCRSFTAKVGDTPVPMRTQTSEENAFLNSFIQSGDLTF